MAKFQNHDIRYIQRVTEEWVAEVDEDGNIVLSDGSMEILDVHETELWCNTCDGLVDYEAHGISDYWQVV